MRTIAAALFAAAVVVPAYGLAPGSGGGGASGSWDNVILSGALSSDHCLAIDARGEIIDSGMLCASQWNKAFAEKS